MTAETKSWEFKAEEVSVIQVETDSGGISLEVAEGPLLRAEATGEYAAEDCEITASLVNGKLRFLARGKKRWFWGGSTCKAGFKIAVPADKKLIVKTGAGHAEVGAFIAGAEIFSGVGTIKLAGLSGPIRISSGVGAIIGEIFSEDFEAKCGAGTLNLVWTETPKAGSASIKLGAGKVGLVFPADTKMKISHASGSGDYSSEIAGDKAAAFRLEIKTGAGSVQIKKK